MIKLFLILLSIPLFGQGIQLSISIDSIATQNTVNERVFTIYYHINNPTEKDVSFFLDTKKIIPSSVSSMQYRPYYGVFQNDNQIDIPQILSQNRVISINESDFVKNLQMQTIEIDSVFKNYKNKGGKSDNKYWVIKNKELKQSIITLKANEIKYFSYKFYWNKNRYFLQDNLEYYLNEKDFYTINLAFDLKKFAFKDQLTLEEFSLIEKDENFIEGVFTSNKIEIDFR